MPNNLSFNNPLENELKNDPLTAGITADGSLELNDRPPEIGSEETIPTQEIPIVDETDEILSIDESSPTGRETSETGNADPLIGEVTEEEATEDPIEPDVLTNPGDREAAIESSATSEETDTPQKAIEVTETSEEIQPTSEENEDETDTSQTPSDDVKASTENREDGESDRDENDDRQNNDDQPEESLAADAITDGNTELPPVELLDFDSGIFTVNGNGAVGINFVYDGGKFKSELAIFSLDGMEEFWSDDDPTAFIAEAARRAASGSELGHIVISDAAEGAKLSGSLEGGQDWNSGNYEGVKTFQMRPGDTFAVMLIPNGKVAQVLANPGIGGTKQPLFSLATANPEDGLHLGQIADVTGDGKTFVMEDIRFDANSDRDYNDLIFQVSGATGTATLLDDAIEQALDWRQTDLGRQLLEAVQSETEESDSGTSEEIDETETDSPDSSDPDNTDDSGNADSIDDSNDATDIDSGSGDINAGNVNGGNIDGGNTDGGNSDAGNPSETEDDGSSEEPTDETTEGEHQDFDWPEPDPVVRYEFAKADQPLIGVLDTGFAANHPDFDYSNITLGSDRVEGDANPLLTEGTGSEHGTHVLGIIAATQNNGTGIDGINDDAPIWLGRTIDSGEWARSLREFVDAAQASNQPNALVNLSLDLMQTNPDGSVTTRYELTPEERGAIEYARQNNVLIVAAAGNDGGVMSVLGQASQEFDNILTVGAATPLAGGNFDRADYSSYGYGLDILAPGGTPEDPILSTVGDGLGTMAGTSVAAATATGAASLVWAANPGLSYRQVIDILKNTATDLQTPGWDVETGAGLLDIDRAVERAQETTGEDYDPDGILTPTTWTGEGTLTPGERAVNSEDLTTRLSVTADGTVGNANSYSPSLSADGRYIVFQSSADNLVSGDTNGETDVFVHDRETGQITRVSIASDGSQGNEDSYRPSISADGRYVVFQSDADNLVSGDTNDETDIFVHDRETRQTTRVSISSNGTQGSRNSQEASISADGRYIVFESDADNLVSGDTNGETDIFVRDRTTGQTTLVSVASDGSQGNLYSSEPFISADGRYVAFESISNNLMVGDTNWDLDIFVHDRLTGETTALSVAPDGTEGNGNSYLPSMSADGRYVVFGSTSSNLVDGDTNERQDIFVYDRQTLQTQRVSVASDGSQGNGSSDRAIISADGRYVAFASFADNLIDGDTNEKEDVFVHDLQTGETRRVSVASDGSQGNDRSDNPSISSDGSYIAFQSLASGLVTGDTSGYQDIFVYDFQKSLNQDAELSEADLSTLVFNIGQTNLNPGNPFNVNFQVSNEGLKEADSFRVGFYLSKDSTVTTDDRFLGFSSIDALAGNSNTDLLTQQLQLPLASDALWSSFGHHYLGAIVDDQNTVNETQEFNNTSISESFYYRSQVDLEGTYFNVLSTPDLRDIDLNAGESFDVQFQVNNTESGTASPFQVSFYLSGNDTVTSKDYFLGSRTINTLAGNSSTGMLTQRLTLPIDGDVFNKGLAGYHIGMIVDSQKAIFETNELNNQSSGYRDGQSLDSDSVIINPNPIDLVGEYFNAPELLEAGESLDLQFRVKNDGLGDAGSFRVGFYLSDDRNIEKGNGNYFLGYHTVNRLDGNDSTGTITTRLTLPDDGHHFWDGSGDYYIGAILDDRGDILEANESNNANTGNGDDRDRVNIHVDNGLEEAIAQFSNAFPEYPWLGNSEGSPIHLGNGVFRHNAENGYLLWNGSDVVAYATGSGVPVNPNLGIPSSAVMDDWGMLYGRRESPNYTATPGRDRYHKFTVDDLTGIRHALQFALRDRNGNEISPQDATIEILNDSMQPIHIDKSNNPYRTGFDGGTYYVRVKPNTNLDYQVVMNLDSGGDSLRVSRDLGKFSGRHQFQDFVGDKKGDGLGDYYRFEVDNPSLLQFSLGGMTGVNGAADVELLDSSGRPIARGNGNDYGSQLLDPGSYYLKVRSTPDQYTNYTLTMQMAEELGDFWGRQEYQNRTLGGDYTQDLYRFNLENSGDLHLKLSNLSGDANVKLYRDNGGGIVGATPISSPGYGDTQGRGEDYKRYQNLPAGQYLVAVDLASGTDAATYDLVMNSDQVGGIRDLGVLDDIAPLSDYVYPEYVGLGDGEDRYQFQVAESGLVHFALKKPSGDASADMRNAHIKLQLHDDKGPDVRFLDANRRTTDEINFATADLKAGQTYFLTVTPEAGEGTNYNLVINPEESEPEIPFHGNPTEANPLQGFNNPLKGAGSLGRDRHEGDNQQYYASDYRAGMGTPIYAMRSGRVVEVRSDIADLPVGVAGPASNWNNVNYVLIEHDNGYRSLYLHLQEDSALVQPGQLVTAGQQIAAVGHNGWSTGPHLHVEVNYPTGSNWYERQTVPFSIDNRAGSNNDSSSGTPPENNPIVIDSSPNLSEDRAGNTQDVARVLNTLADNQSYIYSDWVGSTDTDDYYRFSLDERSGFHLNLSGLSNDAQVQLIKENGEVISGTELYGPGFPGEEISTYLDRGTYHIRVLPGISSANTNYNLSLSAKHSWGRLGVPNGGEEHRAGLERIDGLASIEDRSTWVVIHGMNSNPNAPNIEKLAQTIDGYQEGDQVFALDWSEAAYSDVWWSFAPLPGIGASFIESAGDFAAQKLKKWGIASENINVAGHSLGAYVAGVIADRVVGDIDKLIALDPAAQVPGGYRTDSIDFSNNSRWSWGFYGSALGSDIKAKTATESFKFDFGGLNLDKHHGAVVDAFSNMLVKNNSEQAGTISQLFNLDRMNSDEKPWMTRENEFDAVLKPQEESEEWMPNFLEYYNGSWWDWPDLYEV